MSYIKKILRDNSIYCVSQKYKVYACIMAYPFHMKVNIRTCMTNIGRITFPASFNTIFVKRNFTVDFTSIK